MEKGGEGVKGVADLPIDTNRCRYHTTNGQGATGNRCRDKIAMVDPEHLFCAKHRRCVYVIGSRKKEVSVPKKPTLKHLDFMTFKVSCIEFFIPDDIDQINFSKPNNLRKFLTDENILVE